MAKRIYISGPMSGLPGLNFSAFHEAAQALRGAGYDVVNPAELNPEPGKTWRECMRVDIKALVDCEGVALLPGWTESRGATLEAKIAEGLGMTLWAVPEWLAHPRKAA